MSGFRELRSNHDFTVLWIGQTVSELGTRVSVFVFPLITYAVTGSTMLAAVAGALDLLGMALALTRRRPGAYSSGDGLSKAGAFA